MFTHSIRRRLVIGGVALTATALALAGCGRSSDSPSTGSQATTTVSEGPATGNLTVWAMGTEGENLPKLLEQFKQANPGVNVTVTPIPWDAAHSKFTTAITANTLPDAAMVGTTWMGEFADLGALDPTPQGSTPRASTRAPWTPRRSAARSTAFRGTSRPGSSSTARISPRRPASALPRRTGTG